MNSAPARVVAVLYTGPALRSGQVAIGAAPATAIRAAPCDGDVEADRDEWLAAGETRADCTYFAVFSLDRLVGHIFLHDRDDGRGETLIGYHLFRGVDRGRGTGTAALGLLRDWTLQHTSLERLVVITAETNLASRRAAEKAGFRFVGRPHEDPVGGRVYELRRNHAVD